MYNPDRIIWYASDSIARSRFKLFAYSERGFLRLGDGHITFECREGEFSIDAAKIGDIELIGQPSNWFGSLGMTLIVGAVEALAGIDWFVIFISVVACLAGPLAIGAAIKWVRITYETDDGTIDYAWFADGSSFGWAGIFGGTADLYKLIQSFVAQSPIEIAERRARGETPAASPPRRRTQFVKECPWCEEWGVPQDGMCPACNRPMD